MRKEREHSRIEKSLRNYSKSYLQSETKSQHPQLLAHVVRQSCPARSRGGVAAPSGFVERVGKWPAMNCGARMFRWSIFARHDRETGTTRGGEGDESMKTQCLPTKHRARLWLLLLVS